MIKLHLEKYSRFDRTGEFAEVAVPFAKGALTDVSGLLIRDGDASLRPQAGITAQWPDGSVKWLHLSFLTDLPKNAAKDCFLDLLGGEPNTSPPKAAVDVSSRAVDTGELRAVLAPRGANRLFDSFCSGAASFTGEELEGPVLTSGGKDYTIRLEDDWRVCEEGPYRVILRNKGKHYDADGNSLFDFAVRLHFTAGHPWFKVEYRFIHRENAASLPLERLVLRVRGGNPEADVAVGYSHYRTKLTAAKAAEGVSKLLDAEQQLYESNEQVTETFQGTFFADYTEGEKGLCATVYQAPQNIPKALRADTNGIEIALMPQGQPPLTVMRGMSKTHEVFLHLHGTEEQPESLTLRSLRMQTANRPILDRAVYRAAGVTEDVFLDCVVTELEQFLMNRADSMGKAYGMLCWGDTADTGYTEQGRGKGEIVWSNNEYDPPHAYLLMHARSGERRYLDKLFVAAAHWMDVDICHYSEDPLRQDAQIMHSAHHVTEKVVPSHEWVEGLLDYYHLTGNRRAYHSAMGIGENVVRMLETPMFQQKGGINARETGWALRTLTALYVETGDEKWLEKCEWIVGHFTTWKAEFGGWLSPYTDDTAVRVPFMISVAAGSLMRYYRVRPSERVKTMIVDAITDLTENAILPSGLFFYKELPSLRYVSTNALVLEALSYAYELTGDVKFVNAGLPQFRLILGSAGGGGGNKPFTSVKKIVGNELIYQGPSTKVFAQSHLPLAIFAKALEHAGLLREAVR